jgi:hypothetical protein
MHINKIKKAFSFIEMEGVATKITTLSLISGIGVLLFTQHIIFSSSHKALHLAQNQELPKTDFLREDVINGKAFSGELTHELAVLMSVRWYKEPEYPVLIKLDGSQNLISSTKDNNSKCKIQGMAYTGSSSPVTINIDFKEITCEVNGITERHEIDGRIINIKAETVPASVAFKKKLQSLKNDLKTKTDEGSIAIIKYSIKKIEEAGPALVLPAHIQIQGRTLKKDGKVVIESVNR